MDITKYNFLNRCSIYFHRKVTLINLLCFIEKVKLLGLSLQSKHLMHFEGSEINDTTA